MALAGLIDEEVDPKREEPGPSNPPRSRSGDAADEETQATRSAARRRVSILLADDHDDLRSSLSAMLEGEGYRVVEAADGRIALTLLEGQVFDVLVLDLVMPNVDGMAVLRQIVAPPPVVIVYSAFEYFSPGDVRSEVDAKVFRYLRKPVPPLVFIAAVNEAVAELDQ